MSGPAVDPTTTSDAWGECWRRCSERWRSFGRRVARATGWKVWNPGEYGDRWHSRFRESYAPVRNPVLVFGLNPGPYGMAQTGIPFTDVKRLVEFLPGLAGALREAGEPVEVPALAPRSLRPFLTRTFESSSVRVYRFLQDHAGGAERASRRFVVANPCPLLFIDPETGKNQTPADLRRVVRRNGRDDPVAMQDAMDALRRDNCEDALQTLDPRGVVLLGRDAAKALGGHVTAALGERRVVEHEHPARAIPDVWARTLWETLQDRRLIPR